MIATKEVKRLLGEPDMSDEEAETYRAACYELAEIIAEHWHDERVREAADREIGM